MWENDDSGRFRGGQICRGLHGRTQRGNLRTAAGMPGSSRVRRAAALKLPKLEGWAALRAEGNACRFVLLWTGLALPVAAVSFLLWHYVVHDDPLGVVWRGVVMFAYLGGLVTGLRWTWIVFWRWPRRIIEKRVDPVLDPLLDALWERVKK